MKKLVFLFVAFAAISFASCGEKTASSVATDTASVDTIDTVAVDSIVEADTVAVK